MTCFLLLLPFVAMLDFLKIRRRQAELLDEPDVDPQSLAASLAYIRRINWLLGYSRLIVRQLARFSKRWERRQTIRILDVGTGSADIPRAILRWSHRRKIDVRVVGIDLHARTVQEAQQATAHIPRLHLVRGNALNLPFEDNSFDYAITSMFLHHLDEGDAVRCLAEMSRVARRGVIASDLLRLKRSYAFIWLGTLLSHPMVRHDARVSIAQAFSRAEVLTLRDRASIGFAKYFTHLTHRFVLAGEKHLDG
jgi:ubiquinone/menaquinone biosynthesis C-methylase UbiE